MFDVSHCHIIRRMDGNDVFSFNNFAVGRAVDITIVLANVLMITIAKVSHQIELLRPNVSVVH